MNLNAKKKRMIYCHWKCDATHMRMDDRYSYLRGNLKRERETSLRNKNGLEI